MTSFIKFASISTFAFLSLSASIDSTATVSAQYPGKWNAATTAQVVSRLMQQSATGGDESSIRIIQTAPETGDAVQQAHQSMMAATGDEIAAKHQIRLMQSAAAAAAAAAAGDDVHSSISTRPLHKATSATGDDQSSFTRQMSALAGDDSIHPTISIRQGVDPSSATGESASRISHQLRLSADGTGDDDVSAGFQSRCGTNVSSMMTEQEKLTCNAGTHQIESQAATGDAIHQSSSAQQQSNQQAALVEGEKGSDQSSSARLMFFTALHRFTSPVQRSVLSSSAVVSSPLDFERQLSKAWKAGLKDAESKLVKHATQTRLSGELPSQSGFNRLLQRNVESPIRLSSVQLINQLQLAYQLGGLNSINRLIRTVSPSTAETAIPPMRVATAQEAEEAAESSEDEASEAELDSVFELNQGIRRGARASHREVSPDVSRTHARIGRRRM